MVAYRWFHLGYRFSVLLLISSLIVIAIVLMLALRWWSTSAGPSFNLSGVSVTVYTTPWCQCCHEYVKYLEGLGVEVKVRKVDLAELEALKRTLGVPGSMYSCHTGVLEGYGYFVEGHVPGEAILKLLEEKPKARGIALPGMPPGSPGMPGVKDTLIVYIVGDDGRVEPYWKG